MRIEISAIIAWLGLPLFTMVIVGCGASSSHPPSGQPAAIANARPAKSHTVQGTTSAVDRPIPQRPAVELPVAKEHSHNPNHPQRREFARTLADLVDAADEPAGGSIDQEATQVAVFNPIGAERRPPPINDTKAAVAGIRRLTGKHLTLYTDLPPSREVDELPDVFDLAVPQWCEYFGVDPARTEHWHMFGCVMQEKTRFQGVGLLKPDVPNFLNGFQRDEFLWLHEQPTAYYRRHLLLHEGTHGFMNLLLGSCGPPWYSEGNAELLGTHRWSDGKLTLRYMPRDKAETPDWGRIKIVKDQLAAGRGMMPDSILAYGPTAHLQNEPYGWCWAFAAFLDAHPRFQIAFRDMHRHVKAVDFNDRFRNAVREHWPALVEDWQLFVMNLEYGYDVARAAVVRKPAQALPADGATITIVADRGWQSTGIRLEAERTYELVAQGRFQIGHTSGPWWCEPNGITIHYSQGRPLGLLLGAIRNDDAPPVGLTSLARPEVVGLSRIWQPAQSGTLFLKINESAADLADNRGEITIRVTPH
jgi:hypothetical protein